MKRFFFKKVESITIAAGFVAAFSLLSRILGIVRDRIFAGQFGAGETLDVYFAAFRIPDFIFNIIVLGGLSAGFIPIFTGLMKDKKKAWIFTNNVLNILMIFLVSLGFLGIIFAPFLMNFFTPGFNSVQQQTTAELTRIMFLSPIFLGISGILGGVLQSFKRFLVYALAPIMYNLGIIFGVLYLVPFFGIHGLAWGVVLGALAHALIQVPAIFHLGFRYELFIDFRDYYIRKIFRIMIPRTMSLVVTQVNLLVITIIASTLTSGSLAVFNLANNLQAFPMGIFGISFAIAAFPSLSAQVDNKKEFVSIFSKTFRKILFFIIPSTVLLLTLRAQIIRVILGTGKFDWEDTLMTVDALGFFTLSLFAQAAIPLFARMFFARHDSKTPFLIGLVSVVFNIILSYYLSINMGVAGLALAFSIASILNFILLWIFLRMKIGPMDEVRILVSTIKFSSAAIACGIMVQSMKYIVGSVVDMTRLWGILSQGIVAGLSGLLMYVMFCWIFKSEELINLFERLRNKE